MSINHEIEKSLVQIRAKVKSYNYQSPWQSPALRLCGGSGFVIEGNRIITNAHVVSGQSYIEVRLANHPTWYEAKLDHIGHDCDLAMLSIDNPNFWEGVRPIELGEMPAMEDEVNVYGFPIGGNELCATKGVVSRIELQHYLHSGIRLLDVQVDAAINPGNSGGPALSSGKVVGISHQGNLVMQNQGYIIPVTVLKHFLNDCKLGYYRGFPEVSFIFQPLENPDLRAYYGLKDGQKGIRVAGIDPFSSAHEILKKDDIVLEIDQYPINNDGTIFTDDGTRIDLEYIIQSKYIGDIVSFKIIRNKKEMVLPVPLTNLAGATEIYTLDKPDDPPSYYINSGLLFQPATRQFNKHCFVQHSLDSTETGYFVCGVPRKNREVLEIVMITDILNDKLNQGYSYYINNRVLQINGRHIASLWDVLEAMESNPMPYHTILIGHGLMLVIKNISQDENKVLLDKYMISRDRSKDLVGRRSKFNYFQRFPIGVRRQLGHIYSEDSIPNNQWEFYPGKKVDISLFKQLDNVSYDQYWGRMVKKFHEPEFLTIAKDVFNMATHVDGPLTHVDWQPADTMVPVRAGLKEGKNIDDLVLFCMDKMVKTPLGQDFLNKAFNDNPVASNQADLGLEPLIEQKQEARKQLFQYEKFERTFKHKGVEDVLHEKQHPLGKSLKQVSL